MTLEMKPLRSWKASPVTLGLLVTLVVACITIVCWVLKGESAIRAYAVEAVHQHCDQDIDRSHSDMPKKYVPRIELKEMFYQSSRQLDRMEQTQQTILKRLRDRPRPGR